MIRKETARILRDTIGDVKNVALLDAPNQRNVGDTLIWLGEAAYLEQLGYTITHMSDLLGYDAEALRRDLPPGSVVLLHGGGNFGDLWVGHQALRERIAQELTDYRIVQLPQSVLFSDPQRAATANALISRHPDFTLLLRDSLSIERARQQLPGISLRFCPDMALGYEPPPLKRAEAYPRDLLVIARADREAASGLRNIDQAWASPLRLRITDWWIDAREPAAWRLARAVTRVNSFLVRARRKARSTSKLGLPVPQMPQRWLRFALETLNRCNIEYALDLFTSAKGVVVDRLHAHVLASLLGIPNVILDNSYRKLGAVYDDYTGRLDTAVYCTDLVDARSRLQEMMTP
jgi:pyruvyl transferase EpsO